MAEKHNVTVDQVEEACLSVFIFIKKMMKSFSPLPIRLKYFGSFIPYGASLKNMLKTLPVLYERGDLTEKEYNTKITAIQKQLDLKQIKHDKKVSKHNKAD